MIIFVGDEPSSKNTNPDIPFLGTRSWASLNQWIDLLRIRDTNIITISNSDTQDQLEVIEYYHSKGAKIIALGNKAAGRLTKLNIQYFKLPHPSPRNRQLNDPTYIINKLEICKAFIDSRTC